MSEECVLYRYTLQIQVCILIHLSVSNREVTFYIFERVFAYASKKSMCTRNRCNRNINIRDCKYISISIVATISTCWFLHQYMGK